MSEYKVMFVPYEGMMPKICGRGVPIKFTMGQRWRIYNNYGHSLISHIIGNFTGINQYRVGQRNYSAGSGLLYDEHQRRILSIRVKYNDRTMFFVNEDFESPKINPAYRAGRKWLREAIRQIVQRGHHPIYRVSNEFINNFQARYNFAPTEKQWRVLSNYLKWDAIKDEALHYRERKAKRERKERALEASYETQTTNEL